MGLPWLWCLLPLHLLVARLAQLMQGTPSTNRSSGVTGDGVEWKVSAAVVFIETAIRPKLPVSKRSMDDCYRLKADPQGRTHIGEHPTKNRSMEARGQYRLLTRKRSLEVHNRLA